MKTFRKGVVATAMALALLLVAAGVPRSRPDIAATIGVGWQCDSEFGIVSCARADQAVPEPASAGLQRAAGPV